ncbi:MAG: ABC-F family ATP-binding cassette domain-containing protein [Myxococcota bacterium]
MLTLHNLGKSFGAQTLFTDATLQLHPGNCYGIVGANGSGKSTLLKIMAGMDEPSEGEVSIPKRARVGVLRQDHFSFEEVAIVDVVMMGIPELWEAMAEKRQILDNAADHFDGERYADLEDVVLRYNGYRREAEAAAILEGLNIPEAQHQNPLSTLSGGYKLRVLMAQTLASDPDILLLDEPTNHLDILSIRWLETFLERYEGCAVVISHDRRFLDRVCTHVIDVDYEQVTLYRGNYEAFERQKGEERDRRETEIERRKQEIADHKAFVDRFKSKPTKARQANSRVKRLKKIVIEKLPESSRRHPRFALAPRRSTGRVVVEVEGISKAFGDKQVLHNVSLQLGRSERMAIIGPNGIGKSTLLKIMMGKLEPDAGQVEWGYEAHPGYFSQDHAELDDAPTGTTVESWLWDLVPEQSIGFVRGKLAEVLFSQEEVEKEVRHLSGGESARLLFAGLVVTQPTVLVLDEPTNHLDLEGIESLAAGLRGYEGAMVVVSHDRWFVSQIATRILEIRPDGIEDFRGSYTEYLRHCGDDHLDADFALAQARSGRKR